VLRKGLIGGVGVAVAAAFGAGCVNLAVMGAPLGPQVQDGMVVSGAVAPTVSTQGCAYPSPATVFLGEGQMDIGTSSVSPNEYLAVLQVRNSRDKNDCSKISQPNYQGKYGCNDSNGITVLTANIRYEYPTLSAVARFSNQQTPADGYLLSSATVATGYIPTASDAQVLTKVIDKALARRLAEDPEFTDKLGNDGSVPIVARIRLEGRTDGSARSTSNEFTFHIEAKKSGTFQNCMQSVACPIGTTLKQQVQCFPGQDVPACACQ